jgi:hemerythrin-like domain-containing protein
MTTTPYEGATPDQLRHHLVREFLGVHTMFRRQLDAMLRFVDDLLVHQQRLTGPETTAHVQRLAQATYQYTQMLHLHHHIESSGLFPALRKEGLADAIVERLEAEHDQIAALIDQLDLAIRNVAAVEPQALDSDLRRLAEALRAHLAYEETHVCPLLARFSYWPMFGH